jgi:hypothetical protein
MPSGASLFLTCDEPSDSESFYRVFCDTQLCRPRQCKASCGFSGCGGKVRRRATAGPSRLDSRFLGFIIRECVEEGTWGGIPALGVLYQARAEPWRCSAESTAKRDPDTSYNGPQSECR